MAIKQTNLLTDEFLMDLYFTAMKNEYILSIVCEHILNEYLPDRDFQTLHKALVHQYETTKVCPAFSVIQQAISQSKGAMTLLEDIYDSGTQLTTEECLGQLEGYIRQVRFQKTYREVGIHYNKQEMHEAYAKMESYADWYKGFSLTSREFTDIIGGLSSNHTENRSRKMDESVLRPVNSFYIDELDKRNNGRSLRGQLSCFLASTGVGKSHIARWIGKNACQFGGLNVLHIQLEGSREEVVDAYSASLIGCSAYTFSTGRVSDEDINLAIEDLKGVSGKLYVQAFARFGTHITANHIHKSIQDYKKITGANPDVVIIDSMDLLYLPANVRANYKDERFVRIEVARTLKDIAVDEDIWIVVTYQSTIEDREKLNDEKFVLSEYNCAEAKGLSRPLTHLITLNQTANESKENTMRLNVAKSRFFKRGEPFKIATDYDKECFYDRIRSLNINRV